MIRFAGADDLATLVALERAASTAGLGHIFGDQMPFPEGDVLARWSVVLEDADVTAVIDELDGEAVGYAACGDGWLRHLGVVPELWGTGRAQVLHDHAVATMHEAGAETLYLWVLVENRRARAFYSRLGWVDTGVREPEVFAPYPVKMQMERR